MGATVTKPVLAFNPRGPDPPCTAESLTRGGRSSQSSSRSSASAPSSHALGLHPAGRGGRAPLRSRPCLCGGGGIALYRRAEAGRPGPTLAGEPAILISARGVARQFGRRTALAPVDLELRGGETVALLGPNGAGKSTLLALLARASRPTSGRVEWAAGVRVGWVPQRAAQYARLTARENLVLFARLEGEPDADGAATRLLAALELPDDERASGDLSVGNRQRLNVALGLLGRPGALLLDEPTASLDPWQRRRLWEIVGGVREGGGAVLFSTQHPEELGGLADRVLVLRGGALVFAGTPAEYALLDADRIFA